MIRRALIVVGGVAAAVIVAGVAWLVVAPPELLRVADGYAAKIVCSNHFLAGRDPATVLAVDVQAPGHPILKLVGIAVDDTAQTVTARLLGLFATGVSVYRPGLGCAAVPDGDIAAARRIALSVPPVIDAPSDAAWPDGEGAMPAAPALAAILADTKLTGPGMRAVVVIKDGRIAAETYGEGFDARTPLLGWSMTKTVNAALLGRVMMTSGLGFDDAALFPDWTGDGRKDIKLGDLLAMTSGLEFNEDYGDVSDVNRMLFLEPDMAAFAAGRPLTVPPGTAFNYSSGTAVMLARLWMSRLADAPTALAYPRAALFGPLGMTSAVIEADERGTLVGSSYMYATAHDWARIGQFLLDDGVWNGQRLLPEGFVKRMGTPNGLPGGYSQMQSWIEGPEESDGGAPAGLPADSFWLEGHDGQSIAIVPSARLVVVRLGLTPSKLGYGPELLVKAILAATG